MIRLIFWLPANACPSSLRLADLLFPVCVAVWPLAWSWFGLLIGTSRSRLDMAQVRTATIDFGSRDRACSARHVVDDRPAEQVVPFTMPSACIGPIGVSSFGMADSFTFSCGFSRHGRSLDVDVTVVIYRYLGLAVPSGHTAPPTTACLSLATSSLLLQRPSLYLHGHHRYVVAVWLYGCCRRYVPAVWLNYSLQCVVRDAVC